MAGKSFPVSIIITAKDAASSVLSGLTGDIRGVTAATEDATQVTERLSAAHGQLEEAQGRLAEITRTVTEAEAQAGEGKALNAEQSKAYMGALQGLEEAEQQVKEAEREVATAQKEHNAQMRQNKAAAAELEGAYKTLGRQAGIMGGLIVGAITASAIAAGKYGEELLRASERTGIAVEDISALRYAAEQAGGTLSDLEMGIAGLSRTAYAVATASREGTRAAIAYEQLGISVRGAGGHLKDTNALFMEVIERLSRVSNETERAAIAQAIFGRGARRLLPMMREGAAGIEEMTERARELGIVWDQEDAQAARNFMNALDDVKRSVGSLGRALIGGGQEAAGFFRTIAEGIGTISEFLEQHPLLAKGLALTGLAFGGAMLAAAGLVTGLITLSSTITALGVISGTTAGAAGLGGLGISAAGVGTAITGTLIPAIVAIAPYAAIAIAAVAAIALAWRDAVVVMETYAERSQRIAQEKEAREKYLTPEQRAEIEGVRPTVGERIRGVFTGGGETGQTLAQARAYQAQGYTIEEMRAMRQGMTVNVIFQGDVYREDDIEGKISRGVSNAMVGAR